MNVKCAVIMITKILHSCHRILSGGLCRSRFDGRCHLYCEDSERSHSHFQGIPYTVGTVPAERGKFSGKFQLGNFRTRDD